MAEIDPFAVIGETVPKIRIPVAPYEALEAENEDLRKRVDPQMNGVIVVPPAADGQWPPDGVIDDGRINMSKVRELQEEEQRRKNAETDRG